MPLVAAPTRLQGQGPFHMKQITGSIVALATPLHEDGSVDYPTLRKLVDWHITEGTDCIGVVGTTGESPTRPRALSPSTRWARV